MENWRCLVFLSGPDHFAISAEGIDRVAYTPVIATILGAPPFFVGFFHYSQRPVALLRFDRLMGLEEREPGFYTPLIILKTEPPIALLVEKIQCFTKLDRDALASLTPERSFNGCAEAQLEFEGNPITILSGEKLLLWQERQAIAAFASSEQARLAMLAQEVTNARY